MPFDQNNLPEWNATGVEPPQSKKDNGWGPSEKPPADWFNWFFNKTYNALKSLFDNAQHKEEKGQPNGYASLDSNGKVPSNQISITKDQVGLGNVDNVKQAAKTDFDAHNNDNVRHVTQADKDKWNAMLPAANYTAADVLNKIKTVDGSGSGLDADMVDGKHFTDIQADAQSKANTAESNAKAYTDTAPETMQRNLGIFNVSKSGKDSNGVFTTVDYKRSNGTLFARSVLSNADTNGNYQTRTITYYAADGSTVVRTDTWTLTYDADGDLTSEVKA